ncbi:MAG: LacI family DNA-binding transcriptional regulator [Bryobacteraceae bacterium]|nr:LacI family DNA-binding transcriptional regulator [Bryobacteraceae bacterium]
MKKSGRATIEDVAKLAGVSIATVSAVINGSVPVSPKRTKLVREAMAALNYRRNERGRSLRTGRSGVIGVVVPDVTNPFYPELLRHVEAAARLGGYSVMLCDSRDNREEERRQIEVLHGRGADGVLVTSCDTTASYDWLEDLQLPAVFMERGPMSGNLRVLATDHASASYVAVRHFLELGHERIAFLITRPTLSSNTLRLEGFCRALEEAGLAVPMEYLRSDLSGADEAFVASSEMLALDQPPTAILSTNSLLLLGSARAVREHGLNCPEDVSLIGFDDNPWTEHFNPPLTTLVQPKRELAQEAVRVLVSQIEGDELDVAPPALPVELRLRKSTAPAKVAAMAG